MGDTVDAIGYKADVPARVRDDINGCIESVKGTISGAVTGSKKAARGSKKAVRGTVQQAADAAQSTRRAATIALENPLGLALGALALGFLGGLLIPVSDLERERIQGRPLASA